MISANSGAHETYANLYVISTCNTIPTQDSIFFHIDNHHEVTNKTIPFESLAETFKVDFLSDVLTTLFCRYSHANNAKDNTYKTVINKIKDILQNRKQVPYDINNFNKTDINSLGKEITSGSGFKFFSESLTLSAREMFSIETKEVEQTGILLLTILKQHLKSGKSSKVIILDTFGSLKSESAFYSILPILKVAGAFNIEIELHTCAYEESTPFITDAIKVINKSNSKKPNHENVLLK